VSSKIRESPRATATNKLKSNLTSNRYFFFGGKGGVGKTTSAAATALLLLKHAKPNDQILLFSTDPAHSLSDSLEKKIGNRLTEVAHNRSAKLFAFEMDSKVALEDFRNKHAKVLTEIAERGTLLDEADIKDLLNLSLPGLDEVMALFELSELDRSAIYSQIVIDTAPSGHTTRLLRLPEVFTRMVVALDRMAEKHRYMVAQFVRRRAVADEVDLFLNDLDDRIGRVKALLHSSQTSFTLVTIPEPMAVKETQRYAELLKSEGVVLSDLIINRVEEDHNQCGFCHARVVAQKPWLKELATSFKDLRRHEVPLLSEEVRGVDSLQSIGKTIWEPDIKRIQSRSRISTRGSVAGETGPSDFALSQRRIWIFGGKGGVGKTTAASAAALMLAKSNPKKKILLFSSDPAHSLSDSFNEEIGPYRKKVSGVANLDAMEIDPGQWFTDLKERYRTWTDELFASIAAGSRLEIKFDREAMRELVELTPPGIDEIAALGTIADLIDQDRYHSIVLDTAPTGHLIRFLELPEVALAWVRSFIKLLLKYQNIVRATEVAEELIGLSKSIKRVLALLTNPELCEFVGVAIPERMSLEETLDLFTSLKELKIPSHRLLINGVVPESAAAACSFCKARREFQLSVVRIFQEKVGKSFELFFAPLRDEDIHGKKALLEHFVSWRSLENNVVQLQRRRVAVKNVSKKRRVDEHRRTEKIKRK